MKTSEKIKNPTLGNDDPVLVSHAFLNAMSKEVAKLEEEMPITREHIAGILCAMQITGDDEASAEIEQFIVQLEDELADYKKHFEPQTKMNSEVHHIMRRVGTDGLAKEGLANSGQFINAYISSYLSDGWEIQSTHLIRVVKLDHQPSQRKRWWEFWKTSDGHEQYDLAFDLLWVLVR